MCGHSQLVHITNLHEGLMVGQHERMTQRNRLRQLLSWGRTLGLPLGLLCLPQGTEQELKKSGMQGSLAWEDQGAEGSWPSA